MYTNSSTTILYVTIDFGKNINWYGARAGEKMACVWKDQKVYNNKEGYERLAQSLGETLGSETEYKGIQVGYEPTGVYHEAWIQALQQDFGSRIEVRQIHPTTSYTKRQELQQGRQRKSDQIDLEVLSYCLRDGLSSPAWLITAEDLRFELWVNRYELLHREEITLKTRLCAQFDRLWPGMLVDRKKFAKAHPGMVVPEPLMRSRPLERGLLRAMILHCPNPRGWQQLSADEITAFVRHELGRCGPKTLNKIQGVLQRGLYLPQDLAELLAEQLEIDFRALLDLQNRQAKLEQVAIDMVQNSKAAALVTMPGISPFLAVQYRGYIGPPGRFSSAAQVWAFAGFEPTLHQSGNYSGKSKMSGKGPAGFRNTLYLIGFHTRRLCPSVRRAYERARSHGKRDVGAIIHAAHKANRICFYLYTHQVAYDPSRAR